MTMDTASRRAWEQARTLADLGTLMARWLTGDLKSQPGYEPGCGPEAETRELLAPLAAANRAGYVTTDSQPGLHHDGRGSTIRQRAAVCGFVDDPTVLRRLKQAASREGLIVLDGRRNPPWEIVTTVDGRAFTAFGEPVPARHVRDQWPGLHRQAHKALARAQQITLVHPSWGPAGTRPLCRALQEVGR